MKLDKFGGACPKRLKTPALRNGRIIGAHAGGGGGGGWFCVCVAWKCDH